MLNVNDPKAIKECFEKNTPDELLKYTADLQVAGVLLHEAGWLIRNNHLPFIRWGMENGESVGFSRRWLVSGLMASACHYNEANELAVVKMLIEEYDVDPLGKLESGQSYFNVACGKSGPVTDYLFKHYKNMVKESEKSDSIDEFQKLLSSMNLNVRSYSGRSMYKEECLGVETDKSSLELFIHILDNLPFYEDCVEEYKSKVGLLSESFKSVKSDTLGFLNTIIYFPKIKYIT